MYLHCALCRGPWRILEDVLELRELVCLRFTLNLRCIRCLTRLQEGVSKQGGEPKKKFADWLPIFFSSSKHDVYGVNQAPSQSVRQCGIVIAKSAEEIYATGLIEAAVPYVQSLPERVGEPLGLHIIFRTNVTCT